MKPIKEHILKFTGAVNIDGPLLRDNEYTAGIRFEVTKAEVESNQDGTDNLTYKAIPLLLKTEGSGTPVIGKRKSTWSQKIRGAIYQTWNGEGESEDDYGRVAGWIVANIETIREIMK